MRLWLDDVRPAPDGFHPVKTGIECINLLRTGEVTALSFDHDLGEGLTGYDVAKWIEQNAASIKPILWEVHTSNPVGRQNIVMAMQNAEKAWPI